MTPIPAHCDIERLKLLLADQLPERQQQDLADHVAGCACCRQALESFAGDADWWSEVTTCLQLETSDAGHSALQAELSGADEAFAADFVVDFLEPSDREGVLGRLGE